MQFGPAVLGHSGGRAEVECDIFYLPSTQLEMLLLADDKCSSAQIIPAICCRQRFHQPC